MKIFIVISVVLACALAGPIDENHMPPPEVVQIIGACIAETGASKETALKLKAGDFSDRDEKAQCFTDCFFRKAGFKGEDGEINADLWIAKLKKFPLPETNVEEAVAACIGLKGANSCETSFKAYECYKKTATKTV